MKLDGPIPVHAYHDDSPECMQALEWEEFGGEFDNSKFYSFDEAIVRIESLAAHLAKRADSCARRAQIMRTNGKQVVEDCYRRTMALRSIIHSKKAAEEHLLGKRGGTFGSEAAEKGLDHWVTEERKARSTMTPSDWMIAEAFDWLTLM